MVHNYVITGMTCSSCQAKVQHALSGVEGVKNVSINLEQGLATIEMDKHIPVLVLREALKEYPKYQLTELQNQHQEPVPEEEKRSWMGTYKPILVIFGYILAVTLSIEAGSHSFRWAQWMSHFMAGFFLVFSFFKLLNLKGFAESYSMYDIIAKKWTGWGYVYAFAELLLGFAYLSGLAPLLTNSVTFAVMSVSIIGVLQSVLDKRKIKCACLGDVFNLPMSTVTIIEDGLMIAMSAIMIFVMV
ncbi:MAG: heavy metal translocating P-type ATPase [Bacteroidetes bacterium]|nr:heavy metal translocating P-type ATPase [Bacteroidota bacterium]MBS1973524.1 heavy metal translocating P-type ATPase [Bacteroidota bacterium]